jgi:IPT/TIG domain
VSDPDLQLPAHQEAPVATDDDLPEGYQPPLVHGGLFVDPNWAPRLADRLGSVRTDMGGVAEHWPQDLVPVMYPHIPNGFWREVPLGEAPVPVPTITDIAPVSGSTTGGTVVTVTGTMLANATGVNFGATPGTAFSVGSDTQVTATSPAGSAGATDVTVLSPDGDATLPGAFTYVAPPAPTISTIVPTSGALAGGDALVITGTNFAPGMTAAIGGMGVVSGGYVNPMRYEGTSPPGPAGPADVTVTTAGGIGTLSGGFTYQASAPTVTDVSPSSGSEAGGDGVTVTGTGFVGVDPTTGVMFGPNPATGFVPGTPTQFTCLTPPGTGTVDVSVTGTTGTGTLPGGFTYTADGQQAEGQPAQGSGTDVQQVAQSIQENAETIGEAAQNIGEAAQTLTEPSGTGQASGTTSGASSASTGTTEAPVTGQEPDMTEYEMDQLWGIEPAQPPTSQPAPSS